MRLVVSTFGSAGDVFPMLGLALALRGRGHEVTFATNPYFEEPVRRHGLPFEPLGTAEEFLTTVRNPGLWNPRSGFRVVFEGLCSAFRQQYALHERLRLPGVTNLFGFGALVAREKLGLPVLTVHLQPAVMWSNHEQPVFAGIFGPRLMKRFLYWLGMTAFAHPPVARALDPWRAELGLGPLPRVDRWWHSPDGVIGLFPDWFGPPQPDWPPNVVTTDFPLWNDGSDAGLPADVAAFLDAGEPPLVFTPGSANMHGRAFFAAAVDAARRLGRRALLLTKFPEQLPAVLPPGVMHAAYVPLDQVLPRAAAFVHHGGVGSMSQALAAGVPQLVMPLAHDQFDNLARVVKLGVGAGLGVRRFTGRRVAAVLARLLGSADVATACRAVATRLTARDGLTRAAVAVEARLQPG
ncbi:MAG TPA: glycosyltransferase [Urbifossiella sp.]|nr:glycosyltransferase [Urbifossiella sp.]